MRIKVCCIRSIEEAKLAMAHGADALGLVSKMPTGDNGIGDDRIREIVEAIPPTFSTVLLTPSDDPRAIVRHQRATRANTLQLVGPIDTDGVRDLRDALPGISLIKVVHVADATSIDTALSFRDVADAILLDTKVKAPGGDALGGTGVTHDWSISRRIVESCPLPVFLAGGLGPENVAEGIRTVLPFGVDVCSALRSSGALDPEKLTGFVASVRASRGHAS